MSARTASLWWALAITFGLFGFDAVARTTKIAGASSPGPHSVRGDDRVTSSSSSSSVVAESDPKLSEIQKLQLQNLLLARDLAQARLDALVKELTRPGYDLMGSGEYVKQEKAVAP